MRRVPVLVALALVGCNEGTKAKTAASCGPQVVTIDGKPLELSVGMAHKQTQGSDETWIVTVFNMNRTTCENLLNKSGRAIPTGEISARASYGSGMMGKGVGISSHSQLGLETQLIGALPAKPGDALTICVPKTEFKPKMGEYKDRTVVMSGTFTGTYCGVMAF